MAKRNSKSEQLQWEVIHLKASPASFIGLIDALDEDAAIKLAIKQFDIRKEDQDRLLVRRCG
jgi:hypothetical protein